MVKVEAAAFLENDRNEENYFQSSFYIFEKAAFTSQVNVQVFDKMSNLQFMEPHAKIFIFCDSATVDIF